MQSLPIHNIPMSELCYDRNIKQVFCQQPVVITEGDNSIKINKIQSSLIKEVQTSNLNALIVVNLITEQEKVDCQQSVKNIKISFELPLKGLFDADLVKQRKFDQLFKNLNLQKLFKKQQSLPQKQNQDNQQKKQNQPSKNEKAFGSWSIRLFPFNKLVDTFTHYLYQSIIPLSQYDILSYQKFQRFCTFQYLFALNGYEQKVSQRFQTQIYLNWGQSLIQFVIFNEDGKLRSHVLKPNEIIVIPPIFTHIWKVIDGQNSIGKLIAWKMLPKSTFSTILKNFQYQAKKVHISYPIHQILIDYCFHQFALIQLQSQQLMYALANLLNSQFQNELYLLQNVLKLPSEEILNGANDKKVDQCQICGKFIVNYFGFNKNIVSCMQCVRNDIKIQKVFQKIPKNTFQEGCQILTRIKSYKQEKQNAKENVSKLMENAVFFEYQDICDGDFIGSYHTIHCRNNQTSPKKPRNSQQKIIQNTIKRLKQDTLISNPIDLIKKYSAQAYQNEDQKRLYRNILTRASNFMTKKEEAALLAQMLPNYQQNNLKLFAIKLCVKDNA